MRRELNFKMVKVDDNVIDLFFDNPEDTKAAFRAIKGYLGPNLSDGIFLIAKPDYAIVLTKSNGAWAVWMEKMRKFVSYDVVPINGRYRMIVENGTLVSADSINLPMLLPTNTTMLLSKNDNLTMVGKGV